MKFLMNLDPEDVDEIIRLSLMESYRCCLNNLSVNNKKTEGEVELNHKFLDALDMVISYYSTKEQYSEWEPKKIKLYEERGLEWPKK